MRFIEYEGARVPKLGFGTWRIFGNDCTVAVEHALDLGYRHLDTAQLYDNETAVGRGICGSGVDRGALFITTKVRPECLAPADVQRSTEESLRRLDTPYVDLLLAHWPRRDLPLGPTLEALHRLREQGKVRHVGVSNYPSALLRAAQHLGPLLTNQVEYHPYLAQRALLEQAANGGPFLTAYCPLARGKVLRERVVRRIAASHSKTPAQVVLRWLVQQPHVVAIPKAASPEHRAANFAVFDFSLTPAEMRLLHGLAKGRRMINPIQAPDWDEEIE